MMKSAMILMLLVLVSCQSASNNTTSQPIQTFEVSEQCPHVCWLGINPGVTSVEDAEALLQGSDQIDHKTIVRSEDSMQVLWTTGGMENLYTRVGLGFQEVDIQTIYFTNLIFKLDDLIALFGEPEEISIHVEPADNKSIIYTLYYPSTKTMIYSISGGSNGPNPKDYVDILSLNAEFDSPNLPTWRANDYKNRQPWLGYEHLEEYLKNRP